ncbi:MAG: hydrogenase expression/formation protein HypE [Oligoflexus sp.]
MERSSDRQQNLCTLPQHDLQRITLEHGAGGQMSHSLIHKLLLNRLANSFLEQNHDGAVLPIFHERTAMTTDSYVVNPLFFPGGDIGKLAVFGTTNDLAMCGAQPKYMSLSLIMEEGLSFQTLERVIASIDESLSMLHVQIVTGDTKVVEKGHGDGIYINTTALGVLGHDLNISPKAIQEGDHIIISSDIGRHALAILNARSDYAFQVDIQSDLQSLVAPVMTLIKQGIKIHCLRDLTRGGLASAINEIAICSNHAIELEETTIPIDMTVRDMCEILGFDPYQLANEGCFICILPEEHAAHALQILHSFNSHACTIGRVGVVQENQVSLITPYGGRRILAMPLGVALPRIC